MASSSTDDAKVRNFAGPLIASSSARFGIVASRFNGFIVERLVDGAIDTLIRHGASPENIVVARVPGAWEIPPVLKRLAASRKFDAFLALGAVIRGATPHFEYVAAEASKGVAQLQLETGTPISFGVLTTDTVEQAIERAGSKAGNKGVDAALAVVETLGLLRELEQAGY